MLNDLTKTFFDTFGIEPETGVGLIKFKQPHYPQITDRQYLELMVLHNIYLETKLYSLDYKNNDR